MAAKNSSPQPTPKRLSVLAQIKRGLQRFTLLRLIYRFLFRLGIGQIIVRRPVFYLFRALGMRVLKREDLRRDAAALHLAEYGDEELITGAEPLSAGPVSEQAKQALAAYTLKIARPFTVEIPDVQLVGVSALGFTRDGALIAETMPPYFTKKDTPDNVPALSLIRSRLPAANVPRVERAFTLVNAWNNNYCMWLSECLARLEGLEDYERRTGHRVTVIIPPNPPRYQTESLQLMGYGPDRCLEWNGSRLGVGTLIVSSFRRELRGDFHCRVSLAGLRWVREKMLASLPPSASGGSSFSPRVFVSRRKALARCITNEDEVMRVLAPLGFVTCALEEMSFADQVRLFAQAEFIVAPHGAGLMNLAFAAKPGVVELFGRHIQPSFSELARGFGCRYGFMECPAPRGDLRSWDADLVVDVSGLLRLVKGMLAKRECAKCGGLPLIFTGCHAGRTELWTCGSCGRVQEFLRCPHCWAFTTTLVGLTSQRTEIFRCSECGDTWYLCPSCGGGAVSGGDCFPYVCDECGSSWPSPDTWSGPPDDRFFR